MIDELELEIEGAQFSPEPRLNLVKFRANDNEKAHVEELAQALGSNVSGALRWITKNLRVTTVVTGEGEKETVIALRDGVIHIKR